VGERDTCDVVESIGYLPPGWPYGPVAGVGSQRPAPAATADPRRF
jgi:hypothetical protein